MSTSNTIKWPDLFSANEAAWDSYRTNLVDYFNVCKDNSVLEIAPFKGTHTDIIKLHHPKSITLVETNEDAITCLKSTHSDCEVIYNDIHLYLEKEHPFDVVVCCGLLYHLHSPIHLLELIVNKTNANHIIIETFGTKMLDPIFIFEEDNIPGNRHINNKWKSAKISIRFPATVIITAMKNMGYSLASEYYFNLKPSGLLSDDKLLCPQFFVFEKL